MIGMNRAGYKTFNLVKSVNKPSFVVVSTFFSYRDNAADFTLDLNEMICFYLNANDICSFFQDTTLNFKEISCFDMDKYVIYLLFQDHPT